MQRNEEGGGGGVKKKTYLKKKIHLRKMCGTKMQKDKLTYVILLWLVNKVQLHHLSNIFILFIHFFSEQIQAML